MFSSDHFFSAVSAHSADFDDAIFSHYADGAFHDSNSFSDYNTVIINRLSDDKLCVSSAVFCYRAQAVEFQKDCSLDGSVILCPENGYKFEIKDENTLFMSFIGEPELDMAQEVLANLNNLIKRARLSLI